MPPRPRGPRLRWNPRAGRYQQPNGRFVPATRVRADLDRALADEARYISDLAARLQRGELTVAQWHLEMRTSAKALHTYSAALAEGGWAQMSPAAYGRVGRALRDQYAYLERFAADLRAGLPMDGRFLQRARLYAKAGRQTYHTTELARETRRGRTEYRNVLGGGEHCEQCLAETDKGWQPIGALSPIGSRICLSNCLCHFEYR